MADIQAIVVVQDTSPVAVEVPVPATPVVVEIALQGPPGPPGSAGASSFLALTDTPSTYVGNESKLLQVNPAGDAVRFIDLPAATGDVYGPGSATIEHIAVFDGPSGKTIKDGGMTIVQAADGGFF